MKSRATVDSQIDNLVGALTDPIVAYPGGWGDTIPQDLKAAIEMQRLAQLMKHEEGLATDAEVCAYLMTASLCAPFDHDWSEIYFYVVTKYKGDQMPEDLRKDTITSDQMRDLEHIKRWIWNSRVKHRQEQARAQRRQERAEVEARKPKQMCLDLD